MLFSSKHLNPREDEAFCEQSGQREIQAAKDSQKSLSNPLAGAQNLHE